MNGILLLIPFLLIRFSLLFVFDPGSIQRAAYFAPVKGNERIAYYIYQISNVGIFLYLFFLKIKMDFSSPDDRGLNTDGTALKNVRFSGII